MSRNLSEYAVTYGTKLYLLANSWEVIAYNPPGSQGTFTIPNPGKDGAYRGQTGSESPDIIAIKDKYVLLVECKPGYDYADSVKLKSLRENSEKMEILEELIRRVCSANKVLLPEKLEYIFALAYSGREHGHPELGFLNISVDSMFDITTIVAQENYSSMFKAAFTPASSWSKELLRLLEN